MMAENASEKQSKVWKEEYGFPSFQILCVENQDPPPWFIELLIAAFIDDYGKVNDFLNIMKLWTTLKDDEKKKETTALFSTNDVALPYLSMGFNRLLQKKDKHYSESYGLNVEKSYYGDYSNQEDDAKEEIEKDMSEEEKSKRYLDRITDLTIEDYVTKKVDFSAMLKGNFGRVLYALSIFRKNRPDNFPPFTTENVKAFLEKVFATSVDRKNEESYISFFEAVKSFNEWPNKEEKFLEAAFKSLKNLYGFPNFLTEFKRYIHDLPIFVKFAKENESLVKPIVKMES